VTTEDDLVELLAHDPLATGVRLLTGVVTDAQVFPPLIDTGGGAVPTPCVRGYRPMINDFVQVVTDWNGKFSATRLCLGRIAIAAGLTLRRAANQSSTGGALTTISWDTEDLDQGWGFAPTATDITVPTGAQGVYAITAAVEGAAAWAIGSTLVIRTAADDRARYDLARGASRITATIGNVGLVAADVIQVHVFNNGSTQNFTARVAVVAVA